MNGKDSITPRGAYRAYLKGALSPKQAEQAVQTWYAAAFPPVMKPPRQD